MRSNRFTFEYGGVMEDVSYWRDNLYYLTALRPTKKLFVHDGCVNTVSWDETGSFLLSGSDDRCVTITHAFPENDISRPVYSQKLSSDSNVFTAKFLPRTNNGQILAGFKCGCVLRVYTDRSFESSIQVVYCHGYAVYDILTMMDQPTCFLTLSHDQSAILFDTRLPSSPCTPCNLRCHLLRPVRNSSTNDSTGQIRLSFQFPVTAGDIHPLDGMRRIALAFADGFVRLFDLRRITKGGISPMGECSQPLPYQVTRPLGLPAQLDERRCIRLDYGPNHITSVKFEPIFHNSYGNRWTGGSSLDLGARRLLVSHMYAPVFLFDLQNSESSGEADSKTSDWLPHLGGNADRFSQESTNGNTSSRDGQPNRNRDPDLRIALAFFNWLERRRAQRQAESNANRADGAQPSEESSGGIAGPEQHENTSSTSDDDDSVTTTPKMSPFDLLTEEYLLNVFKSSDRCRQLMAYKGHRSCRTVIKDAVFWGRNHILSGSECGHVIAWNRHTGEPVRAIKADSAVINRIAPHPTLPIFACSGIDHSIKLVEPDPRIYEADGDLYEDYLKISEKHAIEAAKLCETNHKYTIDSLQSGSLHLERLARLRTGQALRQILHRLMDLNRLNT